MADRQDVEVAHRLFWYYDQNRLHRWASRGEKISVGEADYNRGVAAGAFVTAEGEKPAELVEFPANGTDEEKAAWVGTAKVNDIAAYVAEHPEDAEAILAAETASRGDNARKGVEAAVAAALGAQV